MLYCHVIAGTGSRFYCVHNISCSLQALAFVSASIGLFPLHISITHHFELANSNCYEGPFNGFSEVLVSHNDMNESPFFLMIYQIPQRSAYQISFLWFLFLHIAEDLFNSPFYLIWRGLPMKELCLYKYR